MEDADGRVLLGLRRDNRVWAMPGGGAEEGGSFAATALAELHEEVGLDRRPRRPDRVRVRVGTGGPSGAYPNGDLTHYFGIWFVLRRWRGEPVADGDELLELGWFPRAAPPEALMHSSAVALEHYARFLETGVFQIG